MKPIFSYYLLITKVTMKAMSSQIRISRRVPLKSEIVQSNRTSKIRNIQSNINLNKKYARKML
jgi:hypothetical protein